MVHTSLVPTIVDRRLPLQRDSVGSEGDDRRAPASRRGSIGVPRHGAQGRQRSRTSKCAGDASAIGPPAARASTPRRIAVLEAQTTKHYNTTVLPTMGTGATDMSNLRAKGIECYGIGPALDTEDGRQGLRRAQRSGAHPRERAAPIRALPVPTSCSSWLDASSNARRLISRVAMNRGWSYREQVGPGQRGPHRACRISPPLAGIRLKPNGPRASSAARSKSKARASGRRAAASAGQTVVWHRPPWDEDAGAAPLRSHPRRRRDRRRQQAQRPADDAGGRISRQHAAGAGARAVSGGEPAAPAWPLHVGPRAVRAAHAGGVATGARVARSRREENLSRARPAACTRAEHVRDRRADRPGAASADRHGAGGVRRRQAVAQRRRRHSSSAHDQTLFSVEITTGRPHQIRIHMAYAGHPLVGDPLYEAGGGLKNTPAFPATAATSCMRSGWSLRIRRRASA